jgi:hypothetical protein
MWNLQSIPPVFIIMMTVFSVAAALQASIFRCDSFLRDGLCYVVYPYNSTTLFYISMLYYLSHTHTHSLTHTHTHTHMHVCTHTHMHVGTHDVHLMPEQYNAHTPRTHTHTHTHTLSLAHTHLCFHVLSSFKTYFDINAMYINSTLSHSICISVYTGDHRNPLTISFVVVFPSRVLRYSASHSCDAAYCIPCNAACALSSKNLITAHSASHHIGCLF